MWADPSYPERAREVIRELKSKLKKKDDELHNARVDMNFSERKMLVLHEEVCMLRKKNEEAKAMLNQMKREKSSLKKWLAVAIVVVFMFWWVK